MQFLSLNELSKEDYEKMMARSRLDLQRVLPSVEAIVRDVKERGDDALRYYTKELDGVDVKDFKVGDDEFKRAKKEVSREVIEALKKAQKNVEEFHKRQLPKSWSYVRSGVRISQVVQPITSVGCYVPSGRAVYPSTVIMTVTPARVAGVERIACCTPPREEDGRVNELILAACEIAGVKEVYKMGGSQAIAAFAYGTQSVAKVDKIVGPGNIYVTAAKKIVSDSVGIDLPAGPSEVLIIADDSADAEVVASDIIAQAEHDPNASSICVTPSRKLGAEVVRQVKRSRIERAEARESIFKNGAVILVENMEQAINFSNEYAPEHLQLMIKSPEKVLKRIRNAGSVFVGEFSPVAAGDYASGANHVLPTGGSAKVHSGLSVYDFLKFIQVQKLSRGALKKLSDTIVTLAEAEGLVGHAESVRKRL